MNNLEKFYIKKLKFNKIPYYCYNVIVYLCSLS